MSSRPSRTPRDLIVRKPTARNRRLPKRKRMQKLASRVAVPDERRPFLIPVTSLYAAIGWVFLLPACVITTLTLRDGFGASLEAALWRMPQFWFFGLGLLMWLIWFFFLPRPVKAYVFAHELTHALFVILCFGRVQQFHVSEKGGHIVTDRNNLLISLSPYFVPLYTLVAVVGFLLAGAFIDLSATIPLPWGGEFRRLWALYWLMGLTWGFHVTFTAWMIWKDQPDLRGNGVPFSLTFIYLANALFLSGLLILASPDLTLRGFAHAWMTHAVTLANEVGILVQDAIDWIRGAPAWMPVRCD